MTAKQGLKSYGVTPAENTTGCNVSVVEMLQALCSLSPHRRRLAALANP